MRNLPQCPVCNERLSEQDVVCEQCGNNEIEDVSFVDQPDQQAYLTRLRKKREVWQRNQAWLKRYADEETRPQQRPEPAGEQQEGTELGRHDEEEKARPAASALDDRLKTELRQWRSLFAVPEIWRVVWNEIKFEASRAGYDEHATVGRMKDLWDKVEWELHRAELHRQNQLSALKKWVSGLPGSKWDMVGWVDFLNSLRPPVENWMEKLRDEELTAFQAGVETRVEDLGHTVKLELVWIPPGSFHMGSGRNDNEKPIREVTIRNGFNLGKYPVTQLQWAAVMSGNPSSFKGANRPVENISWHDAQDFCRKLSEQRGETFRLPSEAEWEYACCAGTTGDHGGSLDAVARYKTNSKGQTHNVGEKFANRFGLHDMLGNVWEWCEDVRHDNYNGAPTDGSAWVSGGNQDCRMLRGGAWTDDAAYCRCVHRLYNKPDTCKNCIGFRVVRA